MIYCTSTLIWAKVERVSYAQVNKESFTAAQRIQLELKAEQCCPS